MTRLLCCILLGLGLAAAPTTTVHAQNRGYAQDNLRALTYRDQSRLISQEYSRQSRGRQISDDQLRYYTSQIDRSNWSFDRIQREIAQSLDRRGYDDRRTTDDETIRCESQDDRARTCQTPWRGASQLVRQLSDTPCIEGRTWEARGGQIYVTGGCRGEFANKRGNRRGNRDGNRYGNGFGYGDRDGAGNGNAIRCESEDNRARSCRTPWSGTSRLSRQLSDNACIEGRTWQSQRGQVSVSGGCRGEFVAGSGRSSLLGQAASNGGYTVSCESFKGASSNCPWDHRQGQPRLIQQTSKEACVEGRSWGYSTSNGHIWVTDGCRGRFGTQ